MNDKILDKCLTELVDSKTGLIKNLFISLEEPGEVKLFRAMATPGSLTRYNNSPYWFQFACGVGLTREDALMSAVGEFIERYCSCMYDESLTIRATYRQIINKGYNAIKPSAFALFSETQYSNESFPHKRFTEETPVNWVEGKAFVSHEHVWVPACFAWMVGFPERIVFPHSNGLAASPSLEDAIVHALCEVVERDAVMITWFNKLSGHRIPIEEIDQDVVDIMVNRSLNCGFEYHFIDITLDIKIPSVMSITVSRNDGTGVLVGAASKLNVEEAVLKSFFEGCFQARPTVRKLSNGKAPAIKDGLTYLLAHHAMPYANVDAIKHFDFLLKSPAAKPSYPHVDKENSLNFAQSKLKDAGLDVIVVEITTPDIADLGFHVVRAIIPEAIGINAGKHLRYLGGERIYTVPQKLGYKDRRVNEDELNPLPHPFL